MMDDYFRDLYEDPRVKIATAEDLLSEMDHSGVDMSIMCGFGWSSQVLCKMHNDYMLDCISRFPHRLSGLAAVQPLDADTALAEAERCISGGMVGAGELMPDGQGFTLDDSDRLSPFFEGAEEMRLVVLTHATEPVGREYPGKESVTPDVIWNMVQAYPRLQLVLAHWGGGYPFYELMPEVRGVSQGIYYDSAASTYLYAPQVFLHVGQIVGFHRILWATDYPVLTQRRFIQRVRQLPLDPADLSAILGGNAIRLFNLNPRRTGHEEEAVRSWAF